MRFKYETDAYGADYFRYSVYILGTNIKVIDFLTNNENRGKFKLIHNSSGTDIKQLKGTCDFKMPDNWTAQKRKLSRMAHNLHDEFYTDYCINGYGFRVLKTDNPSALGYVLIIFRYYPNNLYKEKFIKIDEWELDYIMDHKTETALDKYHWGDL